MLFTWSITCVLFIYNYALIVTGYCWPQAPPRHCDSTSLSSDVTPRSGAGRNSTVREQWSVHTRSLTLARRRILPPDKTEQNQLSSQLRLLINGQLHGTSGCCGSATGESGWGWEVSLVYAFLSFPVPTGTPGKGSSWWISDVGTTVLYWVTWRSPSPLPIPPVR